MSHRAIDRPRGARARGGGQLLAPRALGLASAPDAQLAEPTARLSVRRRGSGRLHDDGRGDRLHLALRGRVRSARAPAHHSHVGEANGRRDITSPQTMATFGAGSWCWRAAPAMSRACRPFVRPCRRPSRASRHSTIAIRMRCRKVACWSLARRPPVCSSPTKSTARAGR